MKVGDLIAPHYPDEHDVAYSTLAMVVEMVPECHSAKGHPNEAIKIIWCNDPYRKKSSLKSLWMVVSEAR